MKSRASPTIHFIVGQLLPAPPSIHTLTHAQMYTHTCTCALLLICLILAKGITTLQGHYWHQEAVLFSSGKSNSS